jgi:hypothetical protein
MARTVWRRAAFVLVQALVLSPCTVRADDLPKEDDAPPKLQVHGYLSQAYGVAREHPFLGIPTEGTTDYRTLALQFRYALTSKDTFVVQLSHERFGTSPFAGMKPDVALDWGFYERRVTDTFSFRAGKITLPIGIYNEIRNVGTLLPFYRPAFNFYGEGAFASGTLDGVMLTYNVAPESRWSTDVDVYYGGWDLIEVDPSTAQALKGRSKDHIGAQAWLTTPVKGLRVGGGASRWTLRDQFVAPPDPKTTIKEWHASVDGVFDRFTLRGERMDVHLRRGRYSSVNAQLGVNLSHKLKLNLQADVADLKFEIPLPPDFQNVFLFDRPFNQDYAVGVNYVFGSALVLKLEHHWTKGFRFDDPLDILGPPLKARYAILSVSATF